MGQTVGFGQVLDECDEAVHVLATRHTGTLALVSDARFYLLLPRFLAIAPERHDRLFGHAVEIAEIDAFAFRHG